MKTLEEAEQNMRKQAYWAAWQVLEDKKRLRAARWIIRNFSDYCDVIALARLARKYKWDADLTEQEYRRLAYKLLADALRKAIEDDNRGVLPISDENGDLIT